MTMPELPKPGRIAVWQIQIPVVITAGGVLALLILVLTFLFWQFPSSRDVITFFAISSAGAAALVNAIYLGSSIRLDVERRRKEAAFALMDGWNRPEYFHCRKTFTKLVDAFQAGRADSARQVIDNEEHNQNIRAVLNFLEQVAIAIRMEHADHEMLRKAFEGIVVKGFAAAHQWIIDRRSTSERKNLFVELEWLSNEWKNQ
jgi:hypothetical protein